MMRPILAALIIAVIVASCAPVTDKRSDAERSATRTAMPVPPLPGGVIRVRIIPAPTASLLPTVTPNE